MENVVPVCLYTKDVESMDLTVIRYVVFVVVALILIWAVLEMRWRFQRKSKQSGVRRLGSWIDFDTTSTNAMHDESLPVVDEDHNVLDDKASQDMHQRSRQNGHYSGTKKTH
jgi:hypothetical protein